jgi:hypothetical protein
MDMVETVTRKLAANMMRRHIETTESFNPRLGKTGSKMREHTSSLALLGFSNATIHAPTALTTSPAPAWSFHSAAQVSLDSMRSIQIGTLAE